VEANSSPFFPLFRIIAIINAVRSITPVACEVTVEYDFSYIFSLSRHSLLGNIDHDNGGRKKKGKKKEVTDVIK
jgi:hypothetical protein